MTHLDIELLMAYVDNELDDSTKEDVEALLERDPEATAIVERFRQSRALLHESFDEILNYPVPDHLVSTIRNHRTERKMASITSLFTHSNRFSTAALALAASVVLIIGVVTGYLIENQPVNYQTSAPTTELLQQALESELSGTKRTDDETGQSVTPMLTFSMESGQICREYERQSQKTLLFGVACRSSEGEWQTRVEIDSSLLKTPPTTATGYSPAEGVQDPISAALAALGAQKSLTAEEEQRLKERGWQ